jgi:hypothetical protein
VFLVVCLDAFAGRVAVIDNTALGNWNISWRRASHDGEHDGGILFLIRPFFGHVPVRYLGQLGIDASRVRVDPLPEKLISVGKITIIGICSLHEPTARQRPIAWWNIPRKICGSSRIARIVDRSHI